jgi:hypothetical protein
MASSIQQIEAALARVQLPNSQRGSQTPARMSAIAYASSCSFDIDSHNRQPAAGRLSKVKPPRFCKPLRHIVATAPPKPVSMVVQPPGRQAPGGQAADGQASHPPGSVKSKIAQASATPFGTVPSTPPPQAAPPIQVPRLRVRPIASVEVPDLPHSKTPQFSTHTNHSNPMLPLGLLQDIAKEVMVWQTQLKTVHDSVQALYDEGPIVNAWLESVSESETSAASAGQSLELTMAGRYCVCGLDKAGQVWRKLCPPDQLPQVSVAIARHQQLRVLLNQKELIDRRLQRLAQTLTVLRGRLRA